MRLPVGLAVIACAAGLAGCRSNPVEQAYRQTVHGEVRQLEDEYYDLLAEYQATSRELARCRAAQAAAGQPGLGVTHVNSPVAGSPHGLSPAGVLPGGTIPPLAPPAPATARDATPTGSGVIRPPAASGRSVLSPSDELSAPEIDFGSPDDGDVEGPSAPRSEDQSFAPPWPGDDLPPVDREELPPPIGFAGIDMPLETPPAALLPDLPVDHRVTHVVIDPRQTGGRDFDGQPGDDGLSLSIQPRNASDAYVPLPAEISVVVLDPAEAGDAQRVARWDLTVDEVAARLAAVTDATSHIPLHLPWPETPPRHDTLTVFVRYTTRDGRKLETRGDLRIRLAGGAPSRWTPRGDRPPDRFTPRADRTSETSSVPSGLPSIGSIGPASPRGAQTDGAVARDFSPQIEPTAPAEPSEPETLPAPRSSLVPGWSPYR